MTAAVVLAARHEVEVAPEIPAPPAAGREARDDHPERVRALPFRPRFLVTGRWPARMRVISGHG